MSHRTALLIIILTAFSAVLFTGCDVSADRELNRAQAALDMAEEVSAEEHAPDDFLAAEEFFVEAMQANEDHEVQEARRLAIKAKLKAEDAIDKTKDRLRSLNAENERMGR